MIGYSIFTIDDTSDITINGRHFKGTRGLWELLTRKNVTRGVVTADDLKRCKTILQLTKPIYRDTNPRVTCRHRADPSSGGYFKVVPPDAAGRGLSYL